MLPNIDFSTATGGAQSVINLVQLIQQIVPLAIVIAIGNVVTAIVQLLKITVLKPK